MDTPDETMNEQGGERKLAAIMFTDIKGFSHKMAENEGAAFDLLKKHDAMLRVLSTKFGGKVVKSIGDSFMVDFASAVNAVKCAIEAQKKFHSHNKGISEFEKIEIRIGIHVGDVLIRGDDIFGDGVNVASRIESIATPTRICITSDVYRQIRKRMDVEVFRMGDMKLKNIPEPVEVFEVLLPDIPEFSKPSDKASELSKKHSLEASEDHARRVAGRAGHVSPPPTPSKPLTDEEKVKHAEELYDRAEKFFQMGRIEEAEAVLKQVEDLVPSYQPSDNKRKLEEENESKAQVHLQKASEFIAQGKLDEAESETKKVFEYYPLHVGAQQILLRVEEERYRVQEEKRLKRHSDDKAKAVLTEEQRKVSELLAEAERLGQEESFTEAIYTLRELYVLDPNNSTARALEKEIKDAQEAKVERDRIEAEEEERRAEEERQARQQHRAEESHRVSQQTRPVERKNYLPIILRVSAVVVVATLLYFALPGIIHTFFPVRITVAALPFTGSENPGFTRGLPIEILNDLSRVNNVTIRATASSFPLDLRTLGSQGVAAALKVTHLLAGSIDSSSQGYDVTVRLFDVNEQQAVFVRKFPLTFERLSSARKQLVESIIEELGINGDAPNVSQPTTDKAAYQSYLMALALIESDRTDDLLQARLLMESLIESGVEFPEGAAVLAESYARLGMMGQATADALEYAVGIVQQAARQAPSDPSVLRSYAASLIAAGRFFQAVPVLARAITLAPQMAELHRLSALISLVGGDGTTAGKSIPLIETFDPTNPRTYVLKGLIAHLGGDNVAAARHYQSAIDAGGNRSFLMSSYLASAWLRGTNRDGAVAYYAALEAQRPQDYRVSYLLGRAYAEKLDSAQFWFDKGLRLTQRALDADRTDNSALVYNALFLTRLGRFQDASIILKRLQDAGVSEPTIRYRIANAYALQNKKEEALPMLASALESRYSITEVLNPDFAAYFGDPEFRKLVNRTIQPPQ